MNSILLNPIAAHQTAIYVLLHDWYPVRIELLESVCFQMQDVCLLLVPGKRYKAKDLCGHAYWALLKGGERLLVGSCISHLVRTRELALIKVSEDGTYPNQYVLRVQ